MNSVLLPSRRALRWGEYLLLIIGFACIAGFCWWLVQDAVYQSYSNYALEQKALGREPTWPGYAEWLWRGEKAAAPAETVEAPPAPPPPPPHETIAIPPGGLIGRIEIPRIKVSATVREGIDPKILRKAAGHIPDTPFPGQAGNVGVAAHRDQHFRNLQHIKVGDTIRVVTPFTTFSYVVDSLKIVWPQNVEVLDPTPEPVLTLVTCFPFKYIGNAPKRFIVRARQVSSEPHTGEPRTSD